MPIASHVRTGPQVQKVYKAAQTTILAHRAVGVDPTKAVKLGESVVLTGCEFVIRVGRPLH